MPTFVQLAISLVGELGLNHNPSEVHPPFCVDNHRPPTTSMQRTNEERRAVLGCFYVSSVISASLQRVESLRWTPYMRECLDVLEQSRETLTDEDLVYQIKLQILVEKATMASTYDALFDTPDRLRTPSHVHAEALATQLGSLKKEIGDAFVKRKQTIGCLPNGYTEGEAIMDLHVLTAELIIYETALSSTQPPQTTLAFSGTRPYHRNRYLNACLETICSFFRVFLLLQPEEYMGFTFSMISQLIRCLALLYHLSTLEEPGWNKEYVQSTIDLLQILDALIEKTAQVPIAAGIDNTGCEEAEVDVFTRTGRRFKSLRPGWAAALGRADEQTRVNGHNIMGSSQMDEIADFNLDWLDDDWLMSYAILPAQ